MKKFIIFIVLVFATNLSAQWDGKIWGVLPKKVNGISTTLIEKVNGVSGTGGAPITLKTNLSAAWELDEISGTNAVDSHTNSLDATNPNGATVNQVGPTNITPCYDFDGTNDYLYRADHASLDPSAADYSVNIWIKYEGADLSTDLGGVIQKGLYTAAGGEIQIMIRGGGTSDFTRGVYMQYRTSVLNERIAPLTDYTSSIDDGAFHMITVTVDEGAATEGRLYLDGVEIATRTSFTNNISNTAEFRIGRYETFYFDGKIDQPLVAQRAWTPAEVTTLYALGLGYPYTSF